ncbi:MAG: pyridoxamine 5'-phosphate oxidase family protein [Chthoniobacterales bacterium]
MSHQHEQIEPTLAEWIRQQEVFFVATAPLSADGHVNTSPKGGEAFRILGPMEVAYQDYTGSGSETAAHIQENGRIVIMFCGFVGNPKIVRLHGQGTLVTPGHAKFQELAALFPPNPGTRAYVHIAVTRVSDSCGMSVPFYDFKGHRDTLDHWAEKQGSDKLETYRATKNQRSIDNLPSFIPSNKGN